MLIILPPSETKAHGGDNPPLDFEPLSFPSLNPVRHEIATELAGMPVETAMEVLGLSDKLRAEAESNTQLFSSPTMPAVFRYTGVLYDAFDAPSLPAEALGNVAIGSALFGVIGAMDLIPHYRLSGGTKLGGRTLKSRWGSAITEALNSDEFIIDLRSGTYQQLGKVPAVTVRVENTAGKVISHFNKHYKGELARALTLQPIESIEELLQLEGFAFKDTITSKAGCQEVTLVVDR